MNPLVSVICLCYNQAKFVSDAVESVVNQTYKNIELIVVNDASQDASKNVILELCKKYPFIKFINNETNLGMCLSFNRALSESKGSFLIDLAADDILLPERIEKQVQAFEKLDNSYGVVFSDAIITNENKQPTGTFYKRNSNNELTQNVISGDIFTKVVASYQICSPTIMVRKNVFTDLGGYDPTLNYEDYDFFIRSSRNYQYYFINELLTLKRDVKGSNSYQWHQRKNNPYLTSTLQVLKKYVWLSKDKKEIESSLSSIRYHMRQSLFLECYDLTKEYYLLIKNMNQATFIDNVIYKLASWKFPLYNLFSLYRALAHKL